MNDIKTWIKENLQYSRGLICKKCNRNWFEKYGRLEYWEEIHKQTQFLDSINPEFNQRVWHIINDKPLIKCNNPSCNKSPSFLSFNVGYSKTCSALCNQLNPDTIEKIKSTNLEKYGTEYGLQNKDVIKKRNVTIKEKYGVNNISQAVGISEKKRETCLKNYGTEWFLERNDLIEQCVEEKYGVKNVQQIDEISDKTAKTKKDNFYDGLATSERFDGKVLPLFSKEEYDGVCKKYNFQCTFCKKSFDYTLRFERIPRCPYCYPSGTSVFETNILEYIKSLIGSNGLVEEHNRTILMNNKELDIYIPSKNLAIECDGLFWHGETGGNKYTTYHLEKTVECEYKNIRLIHILEDEWKTNKSLIKSKLSHIMNMSTSIKTYSRKCKIVTVPTEIKRIFLNNNHIQGNDHGIINIGLEYETKLVAVMTFCKRRIFMNCNNKIEGEFELSRYASLVGYNVIGGASKLLSYFIKTYTPTKIISYADRRWTYSKNNLYERIGFKKVSNGTPNYWYFGRGSNYKRFHRFGFAKHTLEKRLPKFDSNLTEWENMKNNGWDRIWDCGNLKYEMICS